MSNGPGARRALGWSFANAALGKLGGLLIGVIIARVLGPDDFGTYAIALVALMAVLSFNELGVSLAIVRWDEDPREIAPTVTTISFAASLLVFGAGWIAAPAFAEAMGDASAAPVVQLMLVCVPLNGLVATAAALLQRDYQQGKRTIADQVNTWLGSGLSVVLALVGFGAMSLAIGRVVATIVFSVMLLLFSPMRLTFGWNRRYAGALLRFGLPLAGASIVVFAVGYADQFVVGGVLGAQALGFYMLAFNLAGWPVAMLSQPVRAVAPAAFARIQTDPEKMDDGFRAAMRVLMCVALPLCAFLSAAALPVITFVYGAEWAQAALALQWLALHAAVRIAFELAYDFLAVKRRSTALMIIQAAWLVLLIPAVLFGARTAGIEGVAAAQVIVAVVILIGGYGWALRSAGIRIWRLVGSLGVPLAAGAVSWAAGWLITDVMDGDLLPAMCAGLAALAVCAVVLYLSRPQLRVLNTRRIEESV